MFVWRSFRSLRIGVFAVFVALWNVGFLLSWAVGQSISDADSPHADLVIAVTMALASCFIFWVGKSRYAQEVLLDPTRKHSFHAVDFYFVAGLSAALAVTIGTQAIKRLN